MQQKPEEGMVIKTENDLLALIGNAVEESLYLEYKGAGSLINDESKKSEISKDVSAFANSGGGKIVYGIEEDKSKKHTVPKSIEGIDPAEISKEWLESVINSRIQQRIDGIIIDPIPLGNTDPGKFVYVVSIPASYNAPHQAYDKRYYKRFNFQSVPMVDYEIRDVRNRVREPQVTFEISLKEQRSGNVEYDSHGNVIGELSIKLINNSKQIAKLVYLECDLPKKYIQPLHWQFETTNEVLVKNGQKYRQLRYHHRDQAGSPPLFPGTNIEVLDGNRRKANLHFNMEMELQSHMDYISWVVYADGAVPQTGEISVYELFFGPERRFRNG